MAPRDAEQKIICLLLVDPKRRGYPWSSESRFIWKPWTVWRGRGALKSLSSAFLVSASRSTTGVGTAPDCCHLHLITQGWGFEKADIPSKFLQMLRLHQFMTARPAKTSCLQTACWHERWISKSLKKANLCGVLLTFFQGEGRATKTKPSKDFFSYGGRLTLSGAFPPNCRLFILVWNPSHKNVH